MNVEFEYGKKVISLPYKTVEAIGKLDEKSLKLLILLASDEQKSIGIEESEQIKRLAELGLIKLSGKDAPKQKKLLPQDEAPDYTGEDIDRIFAEKKGMRLLIDECAKIVGKLFNPLETNKIVSLSDYLCLSDEFILLLFNYCVSNGKKSIAYIEKTAYNMFNEGCDTLPKLEEYIKRKEEFNSAEGKMRSLMGLGERMLTSKEKEFFEKWTSSDKWGFSYEMIKKAYEITIDTIGKRSLPYTDRILENWRNAGIYSIEQADDAAKSHKNDGSFDTDEFFELALKRSYSEMDKENKKNT